MALTVPYEETHGSQAGWLDTVEEKPYKIKPAFFIDEEGGTVARADTLEAILELKENYPDGVIRYWEPSQEEYANELAANRELRMNNLGIMT